MKCILLSASYQDRKAVLKFYEPETNKLILWRDNTGHKPHCYVTPAIAEQIKNHSGIESLEEKEIFDVIKDSPRKMINVIARDSLVIIGTDQSLQKLFPCYEADIKYYQNYLYDKELIVGKWYNVGDTITPVEFKSNIDLSQVNMESVIDVDKFRFQCQQWASLLDEPIPNIKRLAFDIEVESSRDELPDPLIANQRVTAISFEGNDIHQVFVLKRSEVPMGEPDFKSFAYDLKFFDSEKEMLEEAFKIIETYPMVLTYNGDMFDMPYLYNRAINLGIGVIPFRMMKKNATLTMGIHLDLYGVFSNHSLKVYAFKNKYVEEGLDSVCQAVLNEGKLKFNGELNQIPLHLLAKYCFNDARLTYKLSNYNNNLIMNLLIILCRISNMTIDDLSRMSISNWTKSLLYFTHRRNHELIPMNKDFEQVESSTKALVTGKKYQGAIVLEPEKGIHFDVTVMDFASLYPSIIKTKNVSYETIRCPHEECKSNRIPQTDHWACTKKTGIISLLIGSLKELRVGHFKRLSKTAPTEEKKQQYEIISESIKVFLNASYGVIGFENFPLYFLPTAETVTAVGRDIISRTVNKARELGMNVIAGDTDSIFIKNSTVLQIDNLIIWAKQQFSIELEVDKEYRYIMFSDRKKNYFGIKRNGELDIKGLTGKKSHTPLFIKNLFNSITDDLKTIMKPSDFENIKLVITEKIKATIMYFDKIPLEKLAFKIMINRDVSEYKIKPQALKAIEQLGITPKKGQFISFIKVKSTPNVKPIQLVKRNEIDKEKYIESIQATLEQITEPMEIDFDVVLGKGLATKITDW